jgi:hypothetical protein
MARNRQLAERARLTARDTIYGFRRPGDDHQDANRRRVARFVKIPGAHQRVRPVGGMMANNGESVFSNFTNFDFPKFDFAKVGDLFKVDTAKKLASWYIDTNEKIANDVLDLEASATNWAKETPLGPIFEANQDLRRRFVKRSAEVARTIFQLDTVV